MSIKKLEVAFAKKLLPKESAEEDLVATIEWFSKNKNDFPRRLHGVRRFSESPGPRFVGVGPRNALVLAVVNGALVCALDSVLRRSEAFILALGPNEIVFILTRDGEFIRGPIFYQLGEGYDPLLDMGTVMRP